jgi:cell division protein FtsZ
MSYDNDTNSLTFDLPKNRSNVIKVLGVGGGGSNAIDHMFQQGITGVDFVVCNTDAQALDNSPVPTKIQLGVNLTEGLGAGANPEIGEKAALESFDDIKNLLTSNTKMLFITAGMGGGTGTGAAPIIAKQAQEMDILTVGIVTVPFQFEGKMRNQQANKGLEKLRQHVDSIIVINNNKLRQVYGNLGYRSGFSKADEVLSTAARGIAEVITHHFKQNVDLHDAKTVLSNSGTAIMGSASASGDDRANKAIKKSLDSPLLNDNKIHGAKNVLLLIVSGNEEVTLDEIGEINDYIQEEAGNNANIIMGVGDDETLEEAISVTVIATGFHHEQQDELVNTEQKKIIHTLEDDQKAEQDLTPNTGQQTNVNYSSAGKNHAVEKTKKYPLFDDLNQDDEVVDETTPATDEDHLIETTQTIRDTDVDIEMVSEDDFEISEQTDDKDQNEDQGIEFDVSAYNHPQQQNQQEDDRVSTHKMSSQHSNFYQANETEDIKKYDLGEFLSDDDNNDKTDDSKAKKEPEVQKTKKEEDQYIKKEIESEQKPHSTSAGIAVDPMNSSIDELRKQAEQRKAKMKSYNYRFKKNQNVDDLEKQPAYKRAGVELEHKRTSSKSGSEKSRTSVHENDQNEIQLRKNNSYLHDNAD